MTGEPLYPEPLVVVIDATSQTDSDSVLDIIGTVAGPAGSSAVEFADGSVWEVDHARPGQLVQFSVSVGGLGASRVVGELIGVERVAEIGAWLEDPSRRRETLRLRGDHPFNRISQPQDSPHRGTSPRSAPLAAAAGRRVVAADLLDDRGADPLVRICAGIEFLLDLDDGDPSPGLEQLRASATEMVATVAAAVTDGDLDELSTLDPKTVARVASMLGGFRRRSGGDAIMLLVERLRRRMDGPAGARSDAGELMVRSAAMMAPMSDFVTAAPDLATPAAATFDADFQDVEILQRGLLRVTIARGDRGRWVRVVRSEGLVTLALAPLLTDGLMQSAELVVPDLTVEDIVVEILDADQMTHQLGAADTIRDALRAGRDAARYERLGHDGQARGRWHECATLWTAAGDQSRAALAKVYADGSTRRADRQGIVNAMIADAIALPDA